MSNLLQPNKIVVNSFFKQVGETNDDFTITLPNQIQNIKSIAFNTIIFPNSMPVFKGANFGTRQNNLLSLIHDTGGTPTSVQITIPTNKIFADGDDLATFLQTEINTATGSSNYQVNFSLEDGARLVIANTVENFTIDYNTTPRGWQKMGFNEQYTNVSSISGNSNINLVRTSVVTIHSNVADNDCLTSIDQDRYDIAVIIPITQSFGGIINYNSSNDRVISEQINGIQTISFVLRDEEGDLIELSPTSYVSMELAIEYNELTRDLTSRDVPAPLPTLTGSFASF